MKKNNLESTNKLLRVIVALLLRQSHEGVLSLREQIKILDNVGLKPAEIAGIVGRSNTYISKELSLCKTKKINKNHGKN